MILAFALLLIQTGTWTPIASLPTPRQEVGVASVEGHVYVIGGFNSQGLGTSVVEIFDTRSNTWRTGPSLPVTLHHPMVAAIGTRVYVAGGYSDSGAVQTTFELDTDVQAWIRKADMPTARGAGAAGAHNGKLYVIGGERGVTVGDAAVFDPATNSWTELPPMPTPRNHHGAAVLRGKIHVVGGRPGNFAVHEAYDPLTNTWTPKASMPTGRSGIAAAAVSNFLFVFGGEGNSASPVGIFSEHEAYNPDLDSWSRLAPMSLPRHGIGAAVVGNRIFIPGGSPVEGFGTTAQSDFFAVNEELLLPQFVVGGSYSTSIVVTNPDPSRVADVTVSLTGLDGSPLQTNLSEMASGSAFRSSVSLSIPPLTSRTVTGSEAPPSALKIGTTRLQSNARLSAYAVVRGPGPQLTVYPSIASRNLVFDVRRVQPSGVNTGVVILNVSAQPATITLRFHEGVNGQEVLKVDRTLAPSEQLARFVHELFTELQAADFVGTVSLRSTSLVAAAVLSFDPSGVVTIPVVPIE